MKNMAIDIYRWDRAFLLFLAEGHDYMDVKKIISIISMDDQYNLTGAVFLCFGTSAAYNF